MQVHPMCPEAGIAAMGPLNMLSSNASGGLAWRRSPKSSSSLPQHSGETCAVCSEPQPVCPLASISSLMVRLNANTRRWRWPSSVWSCRTRPPGPSSCYWWSTPIIPQSAQALDSLHSTAPMGINHRSSQHLKRRLPVHQSKY